MSRPIPLRPRRPVPRPVLVGTTEAMGRLGVSRSTVIRLIKAGDLLAFRIGNLYKIDQASIDYYLGQAQVAPAPWH